VTAAEEAPAQLDVRGRVDPARFGEALAAFCTPVAVVTSHLDGRPHGATVTAFCSLSSAPPLIQVALDSRSELPGLLRDAGSYALNVLAAGQQHLATAFGGGSPDFADVPWSLAHGVPRIDGVAGWILCRLEDLLPGGDHLIAVGHVVHVETRDAAPLLRRGQTFGTLASLPAS